MAAGRRSCLTKIQSRISFRILTWLTTEKCSSFRLVTFFHIPLLLRYDICLSAVLWRIVAWRGVFGSCRVVWLYRIVSCCDDVSWSDVSWRDVTLRDVPCRDMPFHALSWLRLPSHFNFLFICLWHPLNILVGLLRLRKCSEESFRAELKGSCSIVRELHVYPLQWTPFSVDIFWARTS